MEPLSKTPKEAYVEGRLLGLAELVGLLKETLDEDGDHRDALAKGIVQHICNEMNAILDDVHGPHDLEKHQDALQATTKKAIQSVEKTPENPAAVRKSIDTADELMKKLMALREEEKTQ